MNGLLGKFSLENFEEFFNNYKVNNTLAQEASTALDQFILSLNEFFDLCEDLSEEIIMGKTEVSWYSYANVELSGDYIRAKSMYYNEPSFSDVSINMSGEEIEDYNTDMGACFGKVYVYLIKLCIDN
jgi:hypothetical protein